MKPQRIQLRRVKGWRMPDNTVKVTRGKGAAGRWGNPYKVGQYGLTRQSFDTLYQHPTAENCVKWFRALQIETPGRVDEIRAELRGKNLACFCPLDAPCHADVLLELANADS